MSGFCAGGQWVNPLFARLRMLSRSLLAVNFPAQVVNALEPGAEIVLRKNANGTVT